MMRRGIVTKAARGPGGFANLAQSENPYRAMALEFTEAARQAKSVSPTIARRRERLSRKLALEFGAIHPHPLVCTGVHQLAQLGPGII